MHTTHEPTAVPAWPVYALTVHDDGRIVASGPLIPASGHTTRASAVDTVAGAAARLGRPVQARAIEPDGTVWHLVISPNGEVNELPGGAPRAKAPKKRHDKRPVEAATETAAPASTGPAPEPAPDRSTYAQSLALIREHLEEGRVGRAASLATRLDEQAAHALGVSHPDALHVREVRAWVTALIGDAVSGVRLYRDVAERWHYRGDSERAEAVAARAETLWLQITDLDTALSVGASVVRMRHQIPGENGEALTAVLAHQGWLDETRGASGPRAREHPQTDSPAPGRSRPVPAWERPAVNARTTG